MSARNTFFRSLHDLGAAAWFGGTLMGDIGVNGAASEVRDAHDRPRVAAVGWGKWSPASAVAIGAHFVGGAQILYTNRGRAAHQKGVRANTVSKLAITAAALGATAYSGVLGGRVAQHGGEPAHSATTPARSSSSELSGAQQQLRYLQWSLPVLTGAIVVLGAQQGEQQRPSQIASGVGRMLARRTDPH